MLSGMFMSAFGDLETYFSAVATKVHHWLVRSDKSLDVYVRFDQGEVVRAREAGVDRLMAFVHSFLQGSQGMHAFFREAAGGSDAIQRASWGVPLFRSWRR
jgi:hypothetical protein